MSDKITKDAFELLNSEFANHDLEQENARNLENLRKRQQMQQQAKETYVPQEDFLMRMACRRKETAASEPRCGFS